jgi:hypothetical protein
VRSEERSQTLDSWIRALDGMRRGIGLTPISAFSPLTPALSPLRGEGERPRAVADGATLIAPCQET